MQADSVWGTYTNEFGSTMTIERDELLGTNNFSGTYQTAVG
jgi:hypothetical protein